MPTVTKHLPAFIIFALTPCALASEYAWFEKNWETNFELIIAHNPEYQGVDEETERYLRSTHPTRWNVNGGLLTVIHTDGSTHTLPYAISPVDQQTFELILTDMAEGSTFLIHRNETGFCSQLKPYWTRLDIDQHEVLLRNYTGALEVKVAFKDCFQPSFQGAEH